MRAENYVSAANAMDVADKDCSKSKTCSSLVNIIFGYSRFLVNLKNVLVCPADVATNR